MPIRVENLARYPKDWPAISRRIREQAGNCCEQCGVKNYALGGRGEHGIFSDALPMGDNGLHLQWPQPGEYWRCADGQVHRIIRIVLTVAHLDHTPENCCDDNLKPYANGAITVTTQRCAALGLNRVRGHDALSESFYDPSPLH